MKAHLPVLIAQVKNELKLENTWAKMKASVVIKNKENVIMENILTLSTRRSSPYSTVEYRVATTDFWCTFHHDEKISSGWKGWGCTPTSFFHSITIAYKVSVYAPAERADTLPVFHFYPYMYYVVFTMTIMVPRKQHNVQVRLIDSWNKYQPKWKVWKNQKKSWEQTSCAAPKGTCA